MVRLRLPGGRITSATLRRLAELATAYGNGILQLTSRAGLQVRGLSDPLPAPFIDAVADTGLLPTTTHERVRNIVTSPLTGLVGGRADLLPMTRVLDADLIAEPALAELPGRFLFVLDDGRGDLLDLAFDLAYQATGSQTGVVLVGSAEHGLPVRVEKAVAILLQLARGFVQARRASGAWHVGELPAWTDSLGLRRVRVVRGETAVRLGRLRAAASVSVPLARLTLDQTRVVEQVSYGGPIVITPWRGLVLPTAGHRLDELGRAGLVTDERSAWAQLSACVGAPFCAKARTDTGAAARALVTMDVELPRTHLSGCERRCGAPSGAYLDLVAPTIAPDRPGASATGAPRS